MDAVATLRRDAVERLDRLIELQQRSASNEP
jgi:hypothetical protein